MIVKHPSTTLNAGADAALLSRTQSDDQRDTARTWFETIRAWLSRSRQRQTLAELEEHLLVDIGITRTAARKEAAKPFWKS